MKTDQARDTNSPLFWLATLFAAMLTLGIIAGCSMAKNGFETIWSGEASKAGRHNPPGLFPYPRGGPSSPFAQPQPGVVHMPADELWIIAKHEAAGAMENDGPGCGALLAKFPGEDKKDVPLPLKHTDVKAAVAGYIASVEVTQQFHNPYDKKIEAVYLFPLPQNAAVNEFVMTIGERRIRGIIRERKEAEKLYAAAKAQGHVAALLTQERANVFTQKVANLEPGKAIDVNIKYFNTLAYRDGWYEFVCPMVVGPRFNPPGSVDGIGAVARGARGVSGQKTEVQYLRPTERSGHDIALSLDLRPGVKIAELTSINHAIDEKAKVPGHRVVKLAASDRVPNKDFVLRWRLDGDRIQSSLVTHADERGKFFTLMLHPPADLKKLERAPVELVFVLDCSGSMSGEPIVQAKAAITRGLRRLQPGDTFQIIQFSNDASMLGPRPLAATPANIRRAINHVRGLNGGGGTMMIEGIKAALDLPHDEQRLRFVCFLTDGYIGNEVEILREMKKRLSASRVFSLGVGSSVNRFLMNRMAKLGRGAVAYLSLNEDGADVMDRFFNRISHPALTDVKIDWAGAKVREVYPAKLPDLFVGRPVIVTGRYEGDLPAELRLTGRAGGLTTEIDLAPARAAKTQPALPSIWARQKIAVLADRTLWQPNPELPQAIRQLALQYSLMSTYTAFLAVDSTSKTVGKQGTSVNVAVPVPDGVKFEKTVRDK